VEFNLGDHGREDPVLVMGPEFRLLLTITGLLELLPLTGIETCCSATVVGPDTACPFELSTTTFACEVLLEEFVWIVFWMVRFASQPHNPTIAARAPETKSHLMDVNNGYLFLDCIFTSKLINRKPPYR
jgi:hypothetical protein